MMLLKCYTQYISKFGKISISHKTGKGKFSFKPKEWQCQKNVKTFVQLPSFHILVSKVMLKILQARLQQDVNWELPVVQAGFRKDRGIRDQIASNCWIIEKATEFQKKNISFCFIDYTKAFDPVDHSKLWKILQEMVLGSFNGPEAGGTESTIRK